MRKIITVYLLLIITSSSCLNTYEKELVGNYRTDEFVASDSSHPVLPELILSPDKSFILKCTDNNIKGKWEAGDNGDHEWIDFHCDSQYKEYVAGGIVAGDNGELIEITSQEFFLPHFESVTFKKIQKK